MRLRLTGLFLRLERTEMRMSEFTMVFVHIALVISVTASIPVAAVEVVFLPMASCESRRAAFVVTQLRFEEVTLEAGRSVVVWTHAVAMIVPRAIAVGVAGISAVRERFGAIVFTRFLVLRQIHSEIGKVGGFIASFNLIGIACDKQYFA